jgi:hypothetical protein
MASPARTAGWGSITTIRVMAGTLPTATEIDVKDSGNY